MGRGKNKQLLNELIKKQLRDEGNKWHINIMRH